MPMIVITTSNSTSVKPRRPADHMSASSEKNRMTSDGKRLPLQYTHLNYTESALRRE